MDWMVNMWARVDKNHFPISSDPDTQWRVTITTMNLVKIARAILLLGFIQNGIAAPIT